MLHTMKIKEILLAPSFLMFIIDFISFGIIHIFPNTSNPNYTIIN